MLGKHFGVDPNSVHAYVLGEHGDSEFPVWSSANIAGVPLNKLPKYNKKALDKIFKKTQGAAYEVIARKGATYYAIALGVTKIIKTVFNDRNEVLPVSSLLTNYHGVSDVCLSVPCILNSTGIRKQLKVPFNEVEKKRLCRSAHVLKKVIKHVS